MPKRNACLAAVALLFFLNCSSDERDGVPGGPSGSELARAELSDISAFGDVVVGENATRTFTISNNGTTPLKWTNLQIDNDVNFKASANSGTVEAGGSKTVTLTFSPTEVLDYSTTLRIIFRHANEIIFGSVDRTLSGRGTDGKTRIIGLSGDLAFGDVEVGTSATRTLMIGNSGNDTLTWSALLMDEILLSTSDGVFTASATSGTVAAGGSENVTLTFTPASAISSISGQLTITSDKTSGDNTIAVFGTGVVVAETAHIVVSGDTAFGDVAVGENATTTLRIGNIGKSPLTWSFELDIPLDTGNEVFSLSKTSGTVAAGAAETVDVTFAPTEALLYEGTLTVSSNATNPNLAIPVSGTGTTAEETRIIDLSGNLAFGDVKVGTSATRTLTISNTGTAPLTWTAPTEDSDGVFSMSPVSGEVAAGGSEDVTVTFTPAAATSYSRPQTVTSDATSGTNTTTVSGTGTTASVAETRIIGLSGTMAFGNVIEDVSTTTTLTISNSGNSTLTWSGLSTGNGVFTASATSGTVAAGGSANVTLTFTPTAATSYSSTLTVTSDATSGTNTTTLSGMGIAATRIIGLSGTMAFGNVTMGSSGTTTLTITNSGNSPLAWSELSTGDAVFTASVTSGTVAAGGSANVTLTFTPEFSLGYSSTLTITSDKTSGGNTITLTGMGAL